jgi:hypothetical protein
MPHSTERSTSPSFAQASICAGATSAHANELRGTAAHKRSELFGVEVLDRHGSGTRVQSADSKGNGTDSQGVFATRKIGKRVALSIRFRAGNAQPVVRFERISELHYALKTIAYTMINLRHFYKSRLFACSALFNGRCEAALCFVAP